MVADIVGAARRRFGEAGYEATSIDQIAAHDGLGDRYELERLTELLLGAITETAEHVATSPRPGPMARSYAAQLEGMIGAVVAR